MERVEINGVRYYPFKSSSQLIEYVAQNKGILVAINSGKINKATDQTREIINKNIGYADGLGAVSVLHKAGYQDCVKIPGCELWLDIIRRYSDSKSFYLIGGTQEVIDKTISKLKLEFPKLNILGYRNGFLNSPEERNNLIEDVAHKKPDVVFVAMGSPKQELLMGDMFKKHKAIYQGLGGSFKVYCGEDTRAPEWWIRHNLEGPYRVFIDKNGYKKLNRFISDLGFFIKLKLGLFKIKIITE